MDKISKHQLWLDGHGGERANFRKADLSYKNLSNVNLESANFIRANLQGATLNDARLSWGNLIGADLSGADLRRADLRWAALNGANLSGADLRDADLRNANLDGADLTDAQLIRTVGDGKVIRSMQLHYHVVVCDDFLQIGCKGYRLHEWEQFSDDAISSMDTGALDWWKRNKDSVMTFAWGEL